MPHGGGGREHQEWGKEEEKDSQVTATTAGYTVTRQSSVGRNQGKERGSSKVMETANSSGEKGKGEVEEVGEEEEEDDSRDIGGIWQVPSSHKTRKRAVGSLNVPKDGEWGSKYRGKWTPIDDVEE